MFSQVLVLGWTDYMNNGAANEPHTAIYSGHAVFESKSMTIRYKSRQSIAVQILCFYADSVIVNKSGDTITYWLESYYRTIPYKGVVVHNSKTWNLHLYSKTDTLYFGGDIL